MLCPGTKGLPQLEKKENVAFYFVLVPLWNI